MPRSQDKTLYDQRPSAARCRLAFVVLSAAVLVQVACVTPDRFREQADTQVYAILAAKSATTEGMPTQFTIEPGPPVALSPADATQPTVLSLGDAIRVGVQHSRRYQTERENLYLAALSLTSMRHRYDPIFFGDAAADVASRESIETLGGAIGFGVRRMLETGGDLSVSIVSNFLRYLSGGDYSDSAMSAFRASLTQPLLRGAGRRIALEPLTQAERNVVYAIRDFVRFRRSFSVGVAQEYYALLQRRDELENARANAESLRRDLDRSQLMAKAGMQPEFQVDQTKQNELAAQDRYVRAKEDYERGLDAFKITLGLPTEVRIEPDPAELVVLASKVVEPLDISVDLALRTALEQRLDLLTAHDRLEDASRRVYVAADALRPELDLLLSAGVDTEGESQPLNFRSSQPSGSAGLELELPLDRLDERNAYRRALIDVWAAERDLTERSDRITLEVRNALRRLEQAEQSYVIRDNSLALARRRVESVSLLQQAGQAAARDLLEAQEALLTAANAVTASLVDHYNARLDLLTAMESLVIDDYGLWAGGPWRAAEEPAEPHNE